MRAGEVDLLTFSPREVHPPFGCGEGDRDKDMGVWLWSCEEGKVGVGGRVVGD